MKRAFSAFLLAIIFILTWQIPPAESGSNGGTAGAFLRMGLGARALSMGDAGVAIPGNSYGLFYNPASLPFLKNRTVMTTYTYLSLDRHLNFVGVAMPLNPPSAQTGNPLNAGLGLGWINAGTGDIEARDMDGYQIGTFKYSENAFFFSFALQPSDRLAIGFSPKILYSSFPDLTDQESLSTARLGFDAGVLVNPVKRLFLGAQVRNVNAQYRWDTTTLWGDDGTIRTDKFPRLYRLGAAYFFDFGLLLACDYETSDEEDNQIHLGAEYSFIHPGPYSFQLRGGYDDNDLAFGFGFGLMVENLKGQIDYAYQIQDVPPYDSQVISFSVNF